MVERGELTETVKNKIETFMGRKTSVRELRLIPYLHYQMVNDQRINPNQINTEEREILSLWRKAGHIEGGASGLSITKEFWDFMNEILFLAYVAYERDEPAEITN